MTIRRRPPFPDKHTHEGHEDSFLPFAAFLERKTTMHMADALVSPAVGGALWAATAGLAAYSSRRISRENDSRDVPLMGVMGAFVFAAQMLNFAIPGTGSSGHLGGGLLLAILLGPYRGFLTMACVLLIQALFFADGGLLAYGCNVFNLGFFTCFVAYPFIYRPLTRNTPSASRVALASILAAVVGLQLGAFGVVTETIVSSVTSLTFPAFLALMQPIHLAIGVVEGVATAAVVAYVLKARPDLLAVPSGGTPRPARSPNSVLATLAAAALAAGCVVSWFASPAPDGLEWAMEKAGAEELREPHGDVRESLARFQEKRAILPDYGFKQPEEAEKAGEDGDAGEPWPAVSAGTSVSGLVGSGLTLALAVAIGLAAAWLRRTGTGSGGGSPEA